MQEKKINVLHMWCSPTGSGGGGGLAMGRLHNALTKRDAFQSRILCDHRMSPDIDALPRWRVDRLIRKFTAPLGLNDIHRVSSHLAAKHPFFKEADVVHLHGIHTGFLSYLSLPYLSARKPMIFTMHDIWPITGHCAVSYDCEKWRTGCGECPHLDAPPAVRRDATRIEWKLKKWAYDRSRMTIITLSSRHASYARDGLLGHFPIHHIPNGIDVETFHPIDKAEARRVFGIAPARKVVMFAALSLKHYHKGGDLLIKALKSLSRKDTENLTLLLVGGNGSEIREQLDIDVVEAGMIKDADKMAAAYSAADVFVSPTRAEAFGLVIAEAMSCGTPVVAFDVGGVPDLCRMGITGYLAKPEDHSDLAQGVRQVLANDDERRQFATNCRRIAVAEYSQEAVVQQHIDLYRQTVERGI